MKTAARYDTRKADLLPTALANVAIQTANVVHICGDALDHAGTNIEETGICEVVLAIEFMCVDEDRMILAGDRLADAGYDIRVRPDYRNARKMIVVDLPWCQVTFRAFG